MGDQGNEVVFSDRVGIGKETINRFSLVDIVLSDGSKFEFKDVLEWSKGNLQELNVEQKDELLRIASEYMVNHVASHYVIDCQRKR